MINVEMTVREAVELLHNLPEGNTLRERVFSVLESQVGEGKRTLTLHSFPAERKIACIKAVRNGMQWGLKESKDWVEVVQANGSARILMPSARMTIRGTVGMIVSRVCRLNTSG